MQSAEKISNGLRMRWLILSAIPSSLMLGVTTYITTDIAAVPLLWVIPLALYVATFIIVFARKPLISTDHLLGLIGIVLAVAASALFVFNLLGCLNSMIKPPYLLSILPFVIYRSVPINFSF
jgi:hypothetical protein